MCASQVPDITMTYAKWRSFRRLRATTHPHTWTFHRRVKDLAKMATGTADWPGSHAAHSPHSQVLCSWLQRPVTKFDIYVFFFVLAPSQVLCHWFQRPITKLDIYVPELVITSWSAWICSRRYLMTWELVNAVTKVTWTSDLGVVDISHISTSPKSLVPSIYIYIEI